MAPKMSASPAGERESAPAGFFVYTGEQNITIERISALLPKKVTGKPIKETALANRVSAS